MSVRRNTTNRLTLYRVCYTCGKSFRTTADNPFMRQMYNVDGKKQKTVISAVKPVGVPAISTPAGGTA